MIALGLGWNIKYKMGCVMDGERRVRKIYDRQVDVNETGDTLEIDFRLMKFCTIDCLWDISKNHLHPLFPPFKILIDEILRTWSSK